MRLRLRQGGLLTAAIGVSWLVLVVLAFNLVPLRLRYIRLWEEHHAIRQSLDRGQADGSGLRTDRLSEVYEYLSEARADYLNSLETILIAGAAPLLLLLLAMSLTSFGSPRRD